MRVSGRHWKAFTAGKCAKEPGLEKRLIVDWYRRASLIDHVFADGETLDKFYRSQYREWGDFVNQPYQAKITRSAKRITHHTGARRRRLDRRRARIRCTSRRRSWWSRAQPGFDVSLHVDQYRRGKNRRALWHRDQLGHLRRRRSRRLVYAVCRRRAAPPECDRSDPGHERCGRRERDVWGAACCARATPPTGGSSRWKRSRCPRPASSATIRAPRSWRTGRWGWRRARFEIEVTIHLDLKHLTQPFSCLSL